MTAPHGGPPYNDPVAWKVALIGTHGVGKTTLCFDLAARLKRLDVDVDMVREVARACPLPINRDTTVAAQEWILHTQMAWEIEAEARHDVVLCDRSVIDNYCYLVHAAGPQPAWEALLDRWLPTYGLLVKVPIWRRPSYDGVRAVDPAFQERIDTLLEGVITARGLEPLRLEPGERERWPERILDRVLPVVQPTPPLFGPDELAP